VRGRSLAFLASLFVRLPSELAAGRVAARAADSADHMAIGTHELAFS